MTVMTKELVPHGDSSGPDQDLGDERDHPFFADPAEVTAESYPEISNISAGFLMKRVVRPTEPTPPEYVTLPMPGHILDSGLAFAVAKWNLLWESAQFRRRFFSDDEMPPRSLKLPTRAMSISASSRGRSPGTTSTLRCFTCCHSRMLSGTACRCSGAGSGPSWPITRIRIASCRRTSVSG